MCVCAYIYKLYRTFNIVLIDGDASTTDVPIPFSAISPLLGSFFAAHFLISRVSAN